MRKRFLRVVFVLSVVAVLSGAVFAKVERPKGWLSGPYESLWAAVLDLQEQISGIELLPGPQGEQGSAGPPGPGHWIKTYSAQGTDDFQTTDHLDFVDVEGAAIDVEVDRPSDVLMWFVGSCFNSVTGTHYYRLSWDDVLVGPQILQVTAYEPQYYRSFTVVARVGDVAPGTYAAKAKWHTNTGTGTLYQPYLMVQVIPKEPSDHGTGD